MVMNELGQSVDLLISGWYLSGQEGNLPLMVGYERRVILAGDSLKDFHGRAGSLD